jgi:Family of unknown function (DUF6074)
MGSEIDGGQAGLFGDLPGGTKAPARHAGRRGRPGATAQLCGKSSSTLFEGETCMVEKLDCEVVPFPAARRVGSIRRMAHMLASYSAEGAERAITAPLQQQYAAMVRKGIAPEVAKREVRSFEAAVRAQLWRFVILRDGGGDAA